jgi:uncharacterized membrane protein
MRNTNAAVTAISALLTLGVAAIGTAQAGDAPAAKGEMEKCYGVAKAGKNDCAGPAHACAGQSKESASAKEWISLPKGTCEKLSGGTLTATK